MTDSIKQIQNRILQFAKDRDWIQYHSPKNLAMALTVEAGELMEIYQWKNIEESNTLHEDPEQFEHVKSEISDIFVYMAHLVNILGFDLIEAVNKKMDFNEIRFPPVKKVNSA